MPRSQNSRLLRQRASIRPAQLRNSRERPNRPGRHDSGTPLPGPSPPPGAPLGDCFPASSPRDCSLPALSRPKQKHHLACTVLLGNALRRDSRLYTLIPPPPPPSVNTAPFPALRPPPRPQGPKLMTALTSSLFACHGLLQTRPSCSL